MDETTQQESRDNLRVRAAAWLAGVSTLFCLIAIMNVPTWPGVTGTVGVAATVAVVCFVILKGR
jgi:hypothetical protein